MLSRHPFLFWILAFSLLGPFLLAPTACGPSGESPDLSSRKPTTFEFTDAEALLRNARSPGQQNRIRLCERIIEQFPDSPQVEEALYLLGTSYHNQNRVEEAASSFQRLVDGYPGGEFNAYAHTFLQKLNKTPEASRAAIEDLQIFLAENPDQWCSNHALQLANAYLLLEEWDNALETYRRMVEAGKSDIPMAEVLRITAQTHIANVMFRTGETLQAVANYEKALRMVREADSVDAVTREKTEEHIQESLRTARAAAEGGR